MHADADAAEQLQVFTEGKSLHPVHYRPSAQVGGSLVDVEHRRAGERHVQPGVVVVDEFQLFGPVGVFVDFVDEQVRAAHLFEVVGQVGETVGGEVEVLGRDIERCVPGKIFLDVLQDEGRLAHAARAGEAHHAVRPVDLSVQVAVEAGVCLPQQFGEVLL